MPNASSGFPITNDVLQKAYDPNIGPAVQQMQQFYGGYTGPTSLTNVTAQNFPDELATSTVQPASGTVTLYLMNLTQNQVINNISICSAATAASTPTHQWAGIASFVAGGSGKCLATSADGTTTAIGADAVVTYALSTAYTVPSSGLYYVYFCIVGSTVPTIAAAATLSAHGRGNIAPIGTGPGDTGKTTPYAVGATVAAPTAAAAGPLIYLN